MHITYIKKDNTEDLITIGSRVKSLINKKADQMKNKLESKPFDGVEAFQEILENSDFTRLRHKIARRLSKNGETALCIIPHEDTFILDILDNITYTMIGKMEKMVYGTTGAVYTENGVDYLLWTKYEFVDGVPSLSRYIELEDEEGQINKTYIDEPIFFTNTNSLPVEVFFNNSEKNSDVEYYEVGDSLNRLNELDKILFAEYNRSRAIIHVNTGFTDEDPKDIQKGIDTGSKNGVVSADAYNEKLGGGVAISPGSVSAISQLTLMQSLENDIKYKLCMKRDNDSNATNKHNMEIITADEDVMETLLSQRQLREQHWNQFFKKLAKVSGKEFTQLTLHLSDIEQAKVDLLKSTVLEAQMKAQNIASQNNNEEQ